MNKTFSITIQLGNAAMQTERDVANALRALAPRIERDGFEHDAWRILDDNGNSVGEAEISDAPPVNTTLLAIQAMLDRQEWNADTLNGVVDILRAGGYVVRDVAE